MLFRTVAPAKAVFSSHPSKCLGILFLPGSRETLQMGGSRSHLEEETSTTRDCVGLSQEDCNQAGQARALPCREQISPEGFRKIRYLSKYYICQGGS